MTTPLTKTQQGQIYALKLYRFYRQQGLPPFMAMGAVIDSGRAIASTPTAYIPAFTARVAMSVWAAHQYMQWIQARIVTEKLADYWFVGELHTDPHSYHCPDTPHPHGLECHSTCPTCGMHPFGR